MSNSKLVNYTKLSPNHSGTRTHSIDRITPHCVVGQCSVETLGNIFMNKKSEASCNYGIGTDGRVLLCVDEDNRSWCSSSNSNDQRAVTIECASELKHPTHLTIKFIISWLSFALTSASVTARKSFCGLTIKTRL